MSPWDLLGLSGLIVGGLVAWALLTLIAILLVKGGNQKPTPAPPAGPRARLVRSRERAGVVEILPGFGDGENAWDWPHRG